VAGAGGFEPPHGGIKIPDKGKAARTRNVRLPARPPCERFLGADMPKETGLAGKTTGYGTRMPGMAEPDARSFHDQLCRMACRIVPNLPIALALAPAGTSRFRRF
jgi:hypothetical protein